VEDSNCGRALPSVDLASLEPGGVRVSRRFGGKVWIAADPEERTGGVAGDRREDGIACANLPESGRWEAYRESAYLRAPTQIAPPLSAAQL
jgi:hypothetical protein